MFQLTRIKVATKEHQIINDSFLHKCVTDRAISMIQLLFHVFLELTAIKL
jgi:hypothetical protein